MCATIIMNLSELLCFKWHVVWLINFQLPQLNYRSWQLRQDKASTFLMACARLLVALDNANKCSSLETRYNFSLNAYNDFPFCLFIFMIQTINAIAWPIFLFK